MPKQSPEFHCWAHMIQRCYNPKNPGFKHYGGRGITVCDRWRHTSRYFLEDMGQRPPNHCIDRLDNDGPYCKENCRWIPQAISNSNRRSVKFITWRGRTMLLTEWAKVLNVRHDTLYARIVRKHWPLDRAMTESLGLGRRMSQLGHPKYPLITNT